MRIGHCSILLMSSLSFLLVGCSSTDTAHQRNVLADVRSLSVTVDSSAGFTVRKSRNEMSPLGPMFGLIGVGIEAAVRSSSDRSHAETLAPSLGAIDVHRYLTEKVIEELRVTHKFESVAAADGKVTPENAVLQVEMEEWGLSRCLAAGKDEELELDLVLKSTLMVNRKEKRWAAEQRYRDSECHPLSTYSSTPDLLSATVTRALDEVAARIVNDLLYP